VRQRIERHMAIDFSRRAGCCLLQGEKDDQWYESYWLKLPSYGYHWYWPARADLWCQLVLFWHGRDGLTWFWEPVREAAQ
jgi:hypothetical protein